MYFFKIVLFVKILVLNSYQTCRVLETICQLQFDNELNQDIYANCLSQKTLLNSDKLLIFHYNNLLHEKNKNVDQISTLT